MRKWSAIALVTLVLAGASSRASAGESAAPYVGTWTAHLSLDQMYDLGLDPRLAGSFRLVLRKNGTYTTFNKLDGASRGRFTASGRRIVFTNDVGCAVAGFTQKGAYTWAVSLGKLKLTAVRPGSDPCGGRWQTLTYPVWAKR